MRQIAGQKAEFFACFDGGADEDDAFDLVFFHGIDSGGDGEIGFTRTGGPQPEDNVVVQQRADVAVLARGASAYATAFGAEIILLVVVFFFVFVVGGFGFDGSEADGVVVQIALFGSFGEREQSTTTSVGKFAHEGEVFEAAADLDVEGFAQGFEVAVERAAEALEDDVVDVFELKKIGRAHV